MKKYRIATFDFATEDIYEVIRNQFPPNFELLTLTDGSLEDRIRIGKEADFFIAATGAIPTEVIAQAENLKMIQQQGVGFDKTDVELATERGIEVCITPEGTSIGVAEHVVLLILAVYKKIIKISNEMYEGKFPMWDYRTECFEINGKTTGFVGFGRIARESATRLQAFNSNIVFYDSYVNMSKEEQKQLNVRQVGSLDELLQESDIVSIHVPSNDETKGIVDKEFFRKMKNSAIFINTARGDLVNEEDFFEAMRSGTIMGAGIDVFPMEPLQTDNEYIKLPNTVLTPHVSAGTVDALKAKINHVCDNINRFINGEETQHSLNKDLIKINTGSK
ncbi:2-hydroxyacid dehydrogenase [Gudongella sp. SC589]|jgi:phosphoglycerate dehydrogenase-like enzyme|uniref:2-hydroxyacid dehydrogenase n=1 Tax=Gudongella sp. SC589 TaxID=3385990 RepID=UPI003904BE7D